jgi:hypothetical protein
MVTVANNFNNYGDFVKLISKKIPAIAGILI